ncbi:MAG TPA: hypothetical protein VFQ62_09285 [Methylomirabilota bacterium]|jgi:hypothetical protein|nr:hypothetical protein [Methylomirabilota bacterium]
MSRHVSRRRAVGMLVAAIALAAAGAFLGPKVYRLGRTFHEVNVVADRLPDLPAVRAGALQRRREFPVVWAHRVDSLERAVAAAPQFEGMEIDVVYDAVADYFDVGHPPVPSQGLSLEHLLAAVPTLSAHYFWLDFKNLTEANEHAACARLVAIDRKYDIAGRTIVESTSPGALGCFTDHGFYTSYYLFPESPLAAMTAAQVAEYYAEVKANLLASRVNALSAPYRSLPFIEKYFPETDILLWYLDAGEGVRYHAWVTYLRLRPRVKVILVSHATPGYR